MNKDIDVEEALFIARESALIKDLINEHNAKQTKPMYLYLCSQSENTGYDTYDSFVCAAYSAEEAQRMIPGAYPEFRGVSRSWCPSEHVKVEYLGEAAATFTEPCIICDSFNAG